MAFSTLDHHGEVEKHSVEARIVGAELCCEALLKRV